MGSDKFCNLSQVMEMIKKHCQEYYKSGAVLTQHFASMGEKLEIKKTLKGNPASKPVSFDYLTSVNNVIDNHH